LAVGDGLEDVGLEDVGGGGEIGDGAGHLKDSVVGSGSSSRKSTPLWANEISPGCGF